MTPMEMCSVSFWEVLAALLTLTAGTVAMTVTLLDGHTIGFTGR